MTTVLGARDLDRARPAAVALGIAMQRTNILRDIDEDAANGRVYLAQEAVARHGLPRPGRRAELLRDQIAYADASTSAAWSASASCSVAGARSPPRPRCTARSCARSSATATGRRTGRARVPRTRKLAVAAGAAWRA